MERPTLRANLANLKALQAAGQRVPALENMPTVHIASRPYWTAYELLSAQRSSGANGPNPISFADIHAFVCLSRIVDADEIEDLINVVTQLDQMFLADFAKRQKKARERKR